MNIPEHVLETDVLVVGGGMAGEFAAISAKEQGADVLLTEMVKTGLCGMSSRGLHQFRTALPDDDIDTYVEYTVKDCEYMVDQEYCETTIKESWDRFQDLLSFGINFRRDEKGEIEWEFMDTYFPELKQRAASWEPMGDHQHMVKLRKASQSRGVKILDRVFIAELITVDGTVRGAVGFDSREGDFYIIKAKAVVLTTGGLIGPGHGMPNLTGDGYAMALRAGAELRGMEFGRSEANAGIPNGPRFLHLYVDVPEYKVTNAKGEEFMEKYERTYRLKGRKLLGPPWRRHGLAMLYEEKAGNGPCSVDYRMPDMDKRLREYYGPFYSRALRDMERTGVTLDKAVGSLMIGAMAGQGGGIRINVNSETSLPGLYAGGLASDFCGACEHSYPSALTGSSVTGHRGGENAAKYAKTQADSNGLDMKLVKQLKEKIYAPMNGTDGVKPDEFRMNIVNAWMNIHLRDEKKLNKAQEDMKHLDAEAPNLTASDIHELLKVIKAKNLLACSQAVASASLLRKETRLGHIRWDFPMTDNKDWLKWVITRLEGGEIQSDVEDIPIHKWKYKPEPIMVDPLEPRKEASS
jgi:succinate dehydrogenase / fumarate reductase flavoprotein subunit